MSECKIWLTTGCTLRCKYCYEKDEFITHANMKKDIAIKIIEYLHKQDTIIDSVIFHGGEPLLNYEIMNFLVEEMTKINSKVKLYFTTNGTVWNEQIEKMLIHYKKNFENRISLSIDGIEKCHDLNRVDIDGKGSYQQVIKTWMKLKELFPNLRARMTITPETAPYIYTNVVHLHNLGFRKITHAFDCFDNRWSDIDVVKIESEYEKVIEYWKENQDVNISFADGLNFRRRRLERCKTELNININGEIYPCTYVIGEKEYCIGNVCNGLQEDNLKCMKKEILQKDNELCKSCVIKENCIYNRCKFLNLKATGDFFLPPPLACAVEGVENRMLIKYQNDIETAWY